MWTRPSEPLQVKEVQVIAMTTINTVILGPIAGSVEECMNSGWEKTVRNLAICVEMAEIAMTRIDTVILGPIEGSAGECMNNGWEKTVKNLAVCAKLINYGTCQKQTKHNISYDQSCMKLKRVQNKLK